MIDPSSLTETEQFLHKQIPLSRAMGMRVESFVNGQLVLTAPLALNHNHLGTAFGGSLSAMALLAGYCLLWLRLEDRNAHIVVRSSSIRYLRPVRENLRAVCQFPDASVFADFKSQLLKNGKARISLRVWIEAEDRVCVEFKGEFVALT